MTGSKPSKTFVIQIENGQSATIKISQLVGGDELRSVYSYHVEPSGDTSIQVGPNFDEDGDNTVSPSRP
jgi:hypothetical protein